MMFCASYGQTHPGTPPISPRAWNALDVADADATRSVHDGGRAAVVREWRVDGRLVARHVQVSGLAHAWSGGDPSLPFNDAGGPSATALVGEFLRDALP